MDEKIEFTTRGKKQLRSIVKHELKPLIDENVNEMLDRTIENRVNAKMQDMEYRIEDIIKKRVDAMYWSIMEKSLESAEFQELFQTEIIKYLHERWSCGSVPFDEQFNKAMITAMKTIMGGKR